MLSGRVTSDGVRSGKDGLGGIRLESSSVESFKVELGKVVSGSVYLQEGALSGGQVESC